VKLPSNVKVTSEIKHDRLALIVKLDKDNWFRISVSSGGWRVTGKGNMRLHAMMAKKEFEKLLAANYTFGGAIEYMRRFIAASPKHHRPGAGDDQKPEIAAPRCPRACACYAWLFPLGDRNDSDIKMLALRERIPGDRSSRATPVCF